MATPGRIPDPYLHEEPFPYADYFAKHPDPKEWPEDGCNRGLGVLKEVVTFIQKEGEGRPLTLGLLRPLGHRKDLPAAGARILLSKDRETTGGLL